MYNKLHVARALFGRAICYNLSIPKDRLPTQGRFWFIPQVVHRFLFVAVSVSASALMADMIPAQLQLD